MDLDGPEVVRNKEDGEEKEEQEEETESRKEMGKWKKVKKS